MQKERGKKRLIKKNSFHVKRFCSQILKYFAVFAQNRFHLIKLQENTKQNKKNKNFCKKLKVAVTKLEGLTYITVLSHSNGIG